MPKKPSFQMYPGDWMKDPKLSMCQPATRGIWMDLICAMHENDQSGEVQGTVEQLARLCRCLPEEMSAALDDLIVTKTGQVTLCHKIVTVICKRMYREAIDRKNGRERKRKSRGKGTGHENVTTPSSSSTSSSLSSLINKEDKKARAFPLRELFEAFPWLSITEDQADEICKTVGESEAEEKGWAKALRIYKSNHNPKTGYYNPEKIGNVLSVFEQERDRILEKETKLNGKNEQNKGRSSNDTRIANKNKLVAGLRAFAEDESEVPGGSDRNSSRDDHSLEPGSAV